MSSAPQPIATSSVLLETSAGALVIDLFGCDCPLLTARFTDACRAGVWAGAVATEVVPDTAVFFSHAADPVYDAALMSSTTITTAAARWMPFLSVPCGVDNGIEGCATSSAAAVTLDQEQQQGLKAAAAAEFSLSKRRVSSTIEVTDGGYRTRFLSNAAATAATAASAGSLGRKGLLIIEAVHHNTNTTNTTNTTTSSQWLRFGLTLGDRAMDFLDGQYVAIGAAREGLGVIERIRRSPHSSVSSPAALGGGGGGSGMAAVLPPSRYVTGAPRWPRPLRMLRVKHATVLPTPGTGPFLLLRSNTTNHGSSSSSQLLSRMLTEAGCFAHWGAPAVIHAAARHIAAAVRRTEGLYLKEARAADALEAEAAVAAGVGSAVSSSVGRRGRAQPLVILSTSEGSSNSNHNRKKRKMMQVKTGEGEGKDEEGEEEEDGVVESAEYNPHYTGEYLSSDEDGGDTTTTAAGSTAVLKRKELEARRTAALQLHQSKANETLSLMLNILNGVADVSGALRPPETALFVCKLNPATTGEGLAMCFRQFGQVLSAEVVADKKTGGSLCYGFVEFDGVDACYRAFQKMDRALVDDCRIHVDFSQSVSKLWFAKQREMRKRTRDE